MTVRKQTILFCGKLQCGILPVAGAGALGDGMSLVIKHSTPRRVHLQGSGQVRATGVPSCDVMPHFEDAMTRADDHIYELELALSVIHAAAAVCGPLLAEARRLY